ncbi:MAG: hypothetical protein COT85_04635 [Chlamydiae bacterium CG10_big_fil_rev_8_21_14_0_10_42_34]|nr:MAG: hypothetical protein COT85_04635 [Chlamydiae bacterium CG10_big_fil_rev_8_21_14_0_10_42_34]
MKKFTLLFLATFLCNFLLATPIQDHKIDPTALAELVSSLGISEDADLIQETQKQWLRKNQERWEVAELSLSQKNLVLDWATKQGLFAAWKPLYKSYDKALILGATTHKMQSRLDYLKQLWEQGVRFKEVVWLTGDRPLDPRVDGLLDRANNESEAAHIIWEEANLPEDLHNLPSVFVAIPMKAEGSTLKRPNTEDTIIGWLKIAPETCTALFVSDQPFCGYQFAVIKACLPESVQFDLVGQGVDPRSHPSAAAITLDSIARWLYQENLCQSQDK